MKKSGLINQPISAVIAGLGHTDQLVVCDAGLPIPRSVQRIDLALRRGVPGFLETVETVLKEMNVERVILAAEISEHSPHIETALSKLLGQVPIEKVSHEKFKEQTLKAHAIIRTGEFTPYANVILVAGVDFDEHPSD